MSRTLKVIVESNKTLSDGTNELIRKAAVTGEGLTFEITSVNGMFAVSLENPSLDPRCPDDLAKLMRRAIAQCGDALLLTPDEPEDME